MFDFIEAVVGKALKSKTLIVSWLTLISGTFTLWSGSEIIAEYPIVVSALVSALGIVNLVLRYVTKLPLEEK